MTALEGGGLLPDNPTANQGGLSFSEDDIARLLGYERFEAAELEAIPDTLLDEDERAEAIELAKGAARVRHRLFTNDFLDQLFPPSDRRFTKLVFFCEEAFHEGKTIEITSVNFLRDERGKYYLDAGLFITPYYRETLLIGDKPTEMSIRRARSMDMDFTPEGGLRMHSTFKCECHLTVEIRTESMSRLLTRIFDAGKREGLIHNRELRVSLKSLSILVSSK